MDVSIIQQVKIQALVLVPLVKALQMELGKNEQMRSSDGPLVRSIVVMVRSSGARRTGTISGRLWAPSLPPMPATTLLIIR
jgi:hypothetical protein